MLLSGRLDINLIKYKMSTICYKPENVDLPKNALEKCFDKNIDGAGFSFAADGKIYTRKGFKSFESLFNSLLEVEKLSCLIVFSSKQISNENKFLQPLKLDNDHSVGYDGVFLSRKDLNDPTCSQGYNFTNLLKSFDSYLFEKGYFINLLSTALLKSNSGCAAIMNNSGVVSIFNRTHGTELLKCWFSNNPYYNANVTTTNLTPSANTGNIIQCGGCKAWYNLNSLIFSSRFNRHYCRDCTRKNISEVNAVLIKQREQAEISNPYKNHLTNLKNITNIDLVNVLDLI